MSLENEVNACFPETPIVHCIQFRVYLGFPFFVVIKTTPFAPRVPYTAAAASFNMVTLSILLGSSLSISIPIIPCPSRATPSITINASPIPRIFNVARSRSGAPEVIVEVKPGALPIKVLDKLTAGDCASSSPFMVFIAPATSFFLLRTVTHDNDVTEFGNRFRKDNSNRCIVRFDLQVATLVSQKKVPSRISSDSAGIANSP